MKNVLLLALIFLCQLSFGQTPGGKITVAILNEQSAPVENVTVELIRTKDSTLVKSAISDKNGVAEIDKISQGSYLLRTSFLNYKTTYSDEVFITVEKPVVTISSMVITQKQNELKEVTVSAKKPFIQRLSDRIVVNVDGSIVSAGSSALDVLERSPGITMDQDIISLRGKSGVLIMIDGRPTAMSGADLTNYLKGLPAGVIDRVEIITNPSARYEAAGNAGIIDIRMKKDQRLGVNGTYTLGYGQGVYSKLNTGATFNYRNKKMNVFGNYNYSYRKDLNDLLHKRSFYKQNVIIASDEKNNYSTFNYASHTARMGADFYPSKKEVLGFVVSGNFSNNGAASDNISRNYNNQQQPYYSFATNRSSNSLPQNIVMNANYKRTFNKGRELNADADYAVFNSQATSRLRTNFFGLNGNQNKPQEILDGEHEGILSLKAIRVDYNSPMKNDAKFEAGARSSYVSSDNDTRFFDVFPTGSKIDFTKTNHFFYKEYNNAFYINYGKQFKKFDLQAGLRGEQSNIATEQVVGNIRWDSSYFKIFPSAFFNYKISKQQTLGVSISRRIGRPGYGQLNPFLSLSDATAYSTGNPQLLPQLTWAYQMNYTVKNFNFVLEYSQHKNPQILVIGRLLDILPNFPIPANADSNISIERPVNLIKSSNYGLTVYAPFKIKPWWNIINNINVLYNHFNGNIGGARLNTGTPSTYIRTNNLFSLKKGWSAELNGNYFSGRRSGYAIFRPQWALVAGAQKTIMKGQGTLRFNVSDIFWTSVLRFAASYEGVYKDDGRARRETRVANLSFIYRFGNNKVQAERKRTTASEEERKRAG